MTAESLDLKRIELARAYVHTQRTSEENTLEATPIDHTPEAAMTAGFTPMVKTFYDLCKIQSIDITNPQAIDREDIAREALSFVAILNNLGYSALSGAVAQDKPTPTQIRFGGNQVRAKLRDHYNNPDLDTDDKVRAERQKKTEEFYIRGARQFEHMFPEVRLTHQLMRELYETKIPRLIGDEIVQKRLAGAAYSLRDLTIAMGMVIEDIIKTSRQMQKPSAEQTEITEDSETAASNGV